MTFGFGLLAFLGGLWCWSIAAPEWGKWAGVVLFVVGMCLLAREDRNEGEQTIEALKGADLDADVARERALRLSGESDVIEVEPFMADSQRCVWCLQPRHQGECNRDDLPDYVTPEYVTEVNRIKDGGRPRDIYSFLGEDCPEAGGCRRPDMCETACQWRQLDALNRPYTDDDPSGSLPRSLPGNGGN